MQDKKEKNVLGEEAINPIEAIFENEKVKEALEQMAVLHNESPYMRIGRALKDFIAKNPELYSSIQNMIQKSRVKSKQKKKEILNEHRIAHNFYAENHLLTYSEEEFTIKIMEFIYDNNIPYHNADEDKIIEITNKFYEFEKERRKSSVSNNVNYFKDKNNPINYSPSAHLKERMEVTERAKQEGVKLTHFEIALLFYYKNETINRDNANEIANFYQQGSGTQLLEKVEEFKKQPYRIKEHRFSKRYHENIIPLLESNKEAMERAKKTLIEIESKKV